MRFGTGRSCASSLLRFADPTSWNPSTIRASCNLGHNGQRLGHLKSLFTLFQAGSWCPMSPRLTILRCSTCSSWLLKAQATSANSWQRPELAHFGDQTQLFPAPANYTLTFAGQQTALRLWRRKEPECLSHCVKCLSINLYLSSRKSFFQFRLESFQIWITSKHLSHVQLLLRYQHVKGPKACLPCPVSPTLCIFNTVPTYGPCESMRHAFPH